MERPQTCPYCSEKRPVRVSVYARRNGGEVRFDLCAPCWMEWDRSGELPLEETESVERGASDLDLECDLPAETIELDDIDLIS